MLPGYARDMLTLLLPLPFTFPFLHLLSIDYRKSISGACHMLICPVYGPTSFVRTFFVARVSVPLLPSSMSCQRLFMPFNKFTLPATVPNTCLLPLLQQRLLSAAVPRSKCNFKLALQHHRLHSKLACPKITYRIANASLMQ